MKPLFEAINNIFVDDIEEIKEDIFLEVKKRKSDLSNHPYFRGLSPSTIQKRKKWIEEKKKKYEKNDYDVYKEVGPGDKITKTKKSKKSTLKPNT